MLISPAEAGRFLRTYKAMLEQVAGRTLSTAQDYLEARDTLYESPERDRPPTKDAGLQEAVAGACFGKFVVGRHLSRHSELVGTNNVAYWVKGISTELREIVAPWTVIKTVVMPYRGEWICDGLIYYLGIHVGAGMKKDILAQIRSQAIGESASIRQPKSPARPLSGQPAFTEKQGQYLAFIHQYTKLNRLPPAEADLQRYFQVSPPSVHQMVLTLEKRGLIQKIPGQSRTITLLIPIDTLPRLK